MSNDSYSESAPPREFELEETFHFEYDGGADTLSVGVLEAIAAATGVDPDGTQIPLNRSVDPDALDALYTERVDGVPRRGGYTAFTVWNLDVVVHSNGQIFIHPRGD